MSLSFDIIEDLYLLNRNFCSSDYDASVEYLSHILPFDIRKFSSSQIRNGWVIPPRWDLQDAKIMRGGKTIYDATDHPLKVIGLSTSVNKKVTVAELKKHLHYETAFETGKDAIPYHFAQSYRSWDRDWGFCVSENFYNSLEEGEYEILIETEEAAGFLTIMEYEKKGEKDECFYLVAHLDHPGMANDDLAGCAVGVELMKRLEQRETKYTYKLLIVPEIIGSEYYLQGLGGETKSSILGGLFLEALGSDTKLAMQSSFNANSIIDKCLAQVLDSSGIEYEKGSFGKIIGNDEIVFEAHNISMPSLARYPFKEYHTDQDSLSIISKSKLEESVNILEELISKLESLTLYEKKFSGIMCLSNPDFDLYVGDHYYGPGDQDCSDELRALMDGIHFKKERFFINEFVDEFDHLTQEDVTAYLEKWEAKGLLHKV